MCCVTLFLENVGNLRETTLKIRMMAGHEVEASID